MFPLCVTGCPTHCSTQDGWCFIVCVERCASTAVATLATSLRCLSCAATASWERVRRGPTPKGTTDDGERPDRLVRGSRRPDGQGCYMLGCHPRRPSSLVQEAPDTLPPVHPGGTLRAVPSGAPCTVVPRSLGWLICEWGYWVSGSPCWLMTEP